MAAPSPLQQRLETEAKAFQAFQKDHTKLTAAQNKLMSQYNENDMVLKELKLLEPDANCYKLTGPVLLKQDVEEARSNVEKRLQYIGDEMKRSQEKIADLEKKMEEKKGKIMQLQQQAQQPAGKAA